MTNDLDITILYEDDSVLAVNKPAGLIVHPDGRTDEPTLCDWFVKKHPEAAEVGEPLELPDGTTIARPGIVHRLDRDTSGVILLAKTAESHASLKEQFQERTVSKEYIAIVHGTMKSERGLINRPIGRSGADFRRWSAQRGATGKLREAITEYTTLARAQDEDTGYKISVVRARPRTGRTHQIRVHMKAIDHPLVGDGLYAPTKPQVFGLERVGLHSRRIRFEAMNGKDVVVVAPYPADLAGALDRAGMLAPLRETW